MLQFLVGPAEQRRGFSGFWLRIIARITLVVSPVLLLLQGQLTFLPYHHEPVVWVHRIYILMDLALIWYFWGRIRSGDEPTLPRLPRVVSSIAGAAATLLLVLFSVCVATFPNEVIDEHLPNVRLIPTIWWPRWSETDDWTSLHLLLFMRGVDEERGKPKSWFSNQLVLVGQSFVDLDKLDKADVSRSFRGRDLRYASLNHADLRKADFSYAHLEGARFEGANLQGAKFDVANLDEAWLVEASLQAASLKRASLRLAILNGAQLQGASLNLAQLQGAQLRLAKLHGTSLEAARLENASLVGAQLQGAWLKFARLQGASLIKAGLQGAYL